MTLLSAFFCRINGHKPYEHPRVVWEKREPWSLHLTPPNGQVMMVKRCKRCGLELGRRPMAADEDSIEA